MVSMRGNIQLLVLEAYYQKRLGGQIQNIVKLIGGSLLQYTDKHRTNIGNGQNKFCMKKLPVGQQIHAQELKHDERCCSCWANSETDDHLLQCPKQARYQNKIYQVIKYLGKEMDPVLLKILLDGVTKYLTGTRQTKYIVGSSRKQQTDYWDRIHQVTGQETTTNE